jgi:hypothetical protein
MNYEKIKRAIDPNKNTRDLRKDLEARNHNPPHKLPPHFLKNSQALPDERFALAS